MNTCIAIIDQRKHDMRRGTTWMRKIALALLATFSWPLIAASTDDYLFVYRNGEAEWAASGDFNGDALLDAVIVDRVTGSYRIGYQSPGGEHTWIMARASGIASVSGFSVGTILSMTSHSLAFTAEAANRVNLVSAANTTQAGVPISVYQPAVGPNQVVAIDIGGAGNNPLDDLLVASAWNGLAPFRTTTIRNHGNATFDTLAETAANERLERGNRVSIKAETIPVVAIIARGATDTLHVVSYAGGPAETFLQISDLPSGSDYAVGSFAGNGLSHFLAYRPGQSGLSAYPVTEPNPGSFAIGAASPFNFADRIETVITLPGAATTKILIVFDGGSHAAAYNFDGTNPPELIETFEAPEGESLIGAAPLEDNGFRLYSGDGSRTTRSLQYSFDSAAGAFSLDRVDLLPPVSDLTGRGNVFQFAEEPFVAPLPQLLHAGNAADWSSSFSLAGAPPQVDVTGEHFLDSILGLDNPTPINLGASHSLTKFGLVNQYTESVSLFSLDPGAGDQIVDVSAHPRGGLYGRSVAVNFIVGSPGFDVLYRLDPNGAWQTYVAGQPVRIFTKSVLQYRARAVPNGPQTSIRSEFYQFKEDPDHLDSDGDGVPDYVEIANGLDPVRSGSDGDADGFSDLEELLKGTSPSDETDHPSLAGYKQNATFDLVVTPLPLDGRNNVETESLPGTLVRLYNLSGSLLASTTVTKPPALAVPAFALFPDVFIDPGNELFVVATEPHFDLLTEATETRIGRELVSLLPSPAIAPIKVNYSFGNEGGQLNAEAAGWVAAAQAVYGAAVNELHLHDMPVAGATVAAVLETKLRNVLASTSRSNLTLFPFRTADAGRMQYDDDAKGLVNHANPARPAYAIKQMFHSLDAMVIAAPNAQVQSLNVVAHEIYRISSASNNAAPGEYRLPLDVLRDFIRDGVIHSNYLAAGTFPAPLLADAAAGVQFLLNDLESRPVTNLTLRVLPDSFAGPCTTLATDSMSPVNLFDLDGGVFDFPDTFHLLPGSIIQVVGRPDVSSTMCAGLNLEVLSVSLATVPASSDGDTDGNLLIDSWELAFLGMLGSDPDGDFDSDGYSNLQEMLEGSDPSDPLDMPSGYLASFQSLAVSLEMAPGGDVSLTWHWPQADVNPGQFQVLSTPDLNVPPSPCVATITHQGGWVFTAVIPNPGTRAHFYTVVFQF